jgi:hypothetical protein
VTQQFKHRQFPAGNPLANALVVVVGAIVIAVSFVLGIVAFVALATALVVMAAIIGVRVWWLNRRLGGRKGSHADRNGGSATGKTVIEGEYRVVGSDADRDQSD